MKIFFKNLDTALTLTQKYKNLKAQIFSGNSFSGFFKKENYSAKQTCEGFQIVLFTYC